MCSRPALWRRQIQAAEGHAGNESDPEDRQGPTCAFSQNDRKQMDEERGTVATVSGCKRIGPTCCRRLAVSFWRWRDKSRLSQPPSLPTFPAKISIANTTSCPISVIRMSYCGT